MIIHKHTLKQGRKRPYICIKCIKRGTFEERDIYRSRKRETKREREKKRMITESMTDKKHDGQKKASP